MSGFIGDHLKPILCVLLLISRLGDILSTWLVTPSLALEANPIVKKLGWPFAWLTVLICLVPYVSVQASLALLVAFLLVSASNSSKIWMVRAMGETEFRRLLLRLASTSRLSHALLATWLSCFFVMLTGAVFCLFYPDPGADPGYWLGAGIILYGLALGGYTTRSFVRLFAEAKRLPVQAPPATTASFGPGSAG
jgi:hypothetical protein